MADSFMDPLTEATLKLLIDRGIIRQDEVDSAARQIAFNHVMMDQWAEARGIAIKGEGTWRALTLEEQYEKLALEMFTAEHNCKISWVRYDQAANVWSAIASKDGKRPIVSIDGNKVDDEFKRRRITDPRPDHLLPQLEGWRELWHRWRLTDVAAALLAKRHGSPVYGTMFTGDEWKAFTQVGNRVVVASKSDVRAAFDDELASREKQPDVRDLIAKAAEDLMAEKAAAVGGRNSRVMEFLPLREKWTGICIVGEPGAAEPLYNLEATNDEVMIKAGLKRPTEEATYILEQGTTIEGPNAGFHIKDLEQAAAELLKESAEGRAVRSVMYVALHDKWSGQVQEPDYRGALVVSGETVRSRVKAKHG